MTNLNKRYLEQETQLAGKYSSTVRSTLYFAYRPFLKMAGLYLSLGFIGRALLLANANIIGYWVDSFCKPEQQICKPPPEILTGFDSNSYITLLSVMTLIGFILTLVFRMGFSRISAAAVSRIYDEVTMRTSRFPMSFFDVTPVGRIITRFSSDYGQVFRLFGGPLAEFLAIIFDLICMIILITVANPLYLPIVVLIAILNYFVYKANRTPMRRERRQLSASRSPSIAHFAETTQGASTIRTFGKEASFMKRFAKLNNFFLNQKMRTQKLIIFFSIQMNSLTAVLLLITGGLAYFAIGKGLLSIGSLGVAFAFIALSGNTIQMFFEWMAQFEEAMVGMERLDNYLRKDLELGSKLPQKAQFSTKHDAYKEGEEERLQITPLTNKIAAEVKLENLWFRYSPELPWVLKDINFTVKAGEKIGIVGRTGSGKSSLIQALFHLYPIEKGHVLIDGRRALDADLKQYRRAISFIAQDPILLQGPLRDNLSLDENVTDQQMIAVIKKVGLQDWFQFLPKGLDTMIEEKGRNISAGEKQLICMARCLLQNSPVVIMDEATSNIDPQSEEALVRATEEFFTGHTQIIIAHRLSTLENCDRILWLSDGEIKMIGSVKEVLPVFEKAQL